MKISVLSRNPEKYYRETSNDANIIHRNIDKNLHQMHSIREYNRALNAAKLDRMFAKPFFCNLSGHTDSVNIVERHPQRVSWLASGCYDGQIRLWDLKNQSCITTVNHASSSLNGLSFSPSGQNMLVSSNDNIIVLYSIKDELCVSLNKTNKFLADGIVQTLDFSLADSTFVSGGKNISLWNVNKNYPLKTYDIESEGIISVKYNKIEQNIIGAICSGRKFTVYDVRESLSAMKITLDSRINNISWDPLQANNILLASEDSNIYLFDIRYLSKPKRYYQGHVNGVLDVDVSPTGQEFVSASYDRTLRIFKMNELSSREVYHTQRMQRVFCVRYTADSQYVFCGSDDMNIRVWKSESSKPLGYLRSKQKVAINYNKALLKKYNNHPQVRKIQRHRHLPKNLFNQVKHTQIEKEAQKRKSNNRKIFSKTKTKSRKHVVEVED